MKLFVITILISIVTAEPTISNRIFNGELVDIEDVPYIVYIVLKSGFCGGSILSKNYVLTAAHCAENNALFVRYGSRFKNEGGTTVNVTKMIIHSKFNYTDYDVAVLQMENSFVFSEKCQPIKLAEMNQVIKDGTILQFAGFGRIETKYYDDKLRAVDLPYINRETCIHKFSIIEPGKIKITPRMICAGYSTGGKGICHGDSGSPLTMDGVQVGIASWVHDCADDFPSVFQSIASVRDWIQEKTGT